MLWVLGSAVAQWLSAWCETEGPRVRASPASLRCGPWARHIYPSLVLVRPRKTRPYITERLLMGRKESNQTNKQKNRLHETVLLSTQNICSNWSIKKICNFTLKVFANINVDFIWDCWIRFSANLVLWVSRGWLYCDWALFAIREDFFNRHFCYRNAPVWEKLRSENGITVVPLQWSVRTRFSYSSFPTVGLLRAYVMRIFFRYWFVSFTLFVSRWITPPFTWKDNSSPEIESLFIYLSTVLFITHLIIIQIRL